MSEYEVIPGPPTKMVPKKKVIRTLRPRSSAFRPKVPCMYPGCHEKLAEVKRVSGVAKKRKRFPGDVCYSPLTGKPLFFLCDEHARLCQVILDLYREGMDALARITTENNSAVRDALLRDALHSGGGMSAPTDEGIVMDEHFGPSKTDEGVEHGKTKDRR